MASLSSSCLAAAQQAESGDWLDLLEHHMAASSSSSSSGAAAAAGSVGGCALPAVCPPGMRQGLFGAWRLPEQQRPTGGSDRGGVEVEGGGSGGGR
jgi:hypothetical protein